MWRATEAGTYYLEYRDDRGWDRGFARRPAFQADHFALGGHPSNEAHAGMRARRRRPAGPCRSARQDRGRGRGEGDATTTGCQAASRIPVPPPPLSPDWHATDSPYVRVDEVAPDGTWVDVFIGRPVGRGYRVLSPLDLPDDVETSRFQVASGDEIVRTVCFPNGRRFSFAIEQISRELTLAARVRGYGIGAGPSDDPGARLDRRRGGDPAPPGGHGKGERHRDPTVTSLAVRVVAAADGDVGLGGNIHYDVWDDGRLVLRNAPVDGSYSIDVSVSAVGSSGRPRPGGSSRARSWSAGRRWSWEDDYYRAVDGCLDQLSDLAEEIGRESPPGAPPPRDRAPPTADRIRLDRAASAHA